MSKVHHTGSYAPLYHIQGPPPCLGPHALYVSNGRVHQIILSFQIWSLVCHCHLLSWLSAHSNATGSCIQPPSWPSWFLLGLQHQIDLGLTETYSFMHRKHWKGYLHVYSVIAMSYWAAKIMKAGLVRFWDLYRPIQLFSRLQLLGESSFNNSSSYNVTFGGSTGGL